MPKSKKWRPPWGWFLTALQNIGAAATKAGGAIKGAATAVKGSAAGQAVGGALKGAAKFAGKAAEQTPLGQSPVGQLMKNAFQAMKKAPAQGADLMAGPGTQLPAELNTSIARMASATKPASVTQVPWTAAAERSAGLASNPMPSTGGTRRAQSLSAGGTTDPIDKVYEIYKGLKEKGPGAKGRLMGGGGVEPTYYDKKEGGYAEDIAAGVPLMAQTGGGAVTQFPMGSRDPQAPGPGEKPWWWYFRGAS